MVATEHRVAGLTLRLRDIAAAESLAALEGATDPFAPLATER